MKKLLFITACITLADLGACNRLTTFSGSRESDSWPLFRGDPSLSGYTQTRLPAEPLLLWSYKSDSRTVSSPVVYRSVAYWCDKRGRIRGIDKQGEPVFEYDIGTAVDATPLIHDSVLYIGRIDGYMTAISLVEKDTLWRFGTYGQISASPTLSSFEGTEALLFGSYNNLFYSMDIRTGKEIRSFESGYYLNGAATLWENHVVFGGCDAWLRIIDTTTGIQSDSLQLPAYIPASPAL
ncbi:MAG: hypothetical protein LUD15_03800 [Bacteroides sp.]|nr:hypothetical protein [Bacteroides sp.]